MTDVKVTELDALIEQLAQLEKDKKDLEEQTKQKNKEIAKIKIQATKHLNESNRNEYISPFGKIALAQTWNIVMPKGIENKNKLWEWMRELNIYDHYATVNSRSLKSLYLEQRKIAEENGEDLMTFTLPGMEPATLFEKMEFKKPRKIKE